MNNTKWKGSLIKVQLAKESFLDKLKREREGDGEGEGQPGTEAPEGEGRFEREPFRRNGYNKNNNNSSTDWKDNRSQRKVFKDDFDFEIVSNNHLDKKSEAKEANLDDDEEEEDEETSGGISKFKGLLLSYPNGLPPIPIFPDPKDKNKQSEAGTTADESLEQANDGLQIDETMSRLQRYFNLALHFCSFPSVQFSTQINN